MNPVLSALKTAFTFSEGHRIVNTEMNLASTGGSKHILAQNCQNSDRLILEENLDEGVNRICVFWGLE